MNLEFKIQLSSLANSGPVSASQGLGLQEAAMLAHSFVCPHAANFFLESLP